MEVMQEGNRFINGPEARQFFEKMAKFDPNHFKNLSSIKVWPGALLAVYRHVEIQVNPTLLAKLKVTDLGFGQNGAYAHVLNIVTGQTFGINHIPNLIPGFDIGVCFSHRTSFERTLFVRDGAPTSVGICASFCVYHRSKVSWAEPGQDNLELWCDAKKQFTDEGAFEDEVARLSKKAILL